MPQQNGLEHENRGLSEKPSFTPWTGDVTSVDIHGVHGTSITMGAEAWLPITGTLCPGVGRSGTIIEDHGPLNVLNPTRHELKVRCERGCITTGVYNESELAKKKPALLQPANVIVQPQSERELISIPLFVGKLVSNIGWHDADDKYCVTQRYYRIKICRGSYGYGKIVDNNGPVKHHQNVNAYQLRVECPVCHGTIKRQYLESQIIEQVKR